MWLAVNAAAFLCIGYALALRLWTDGSTNASERLFQSTFIGSVLWLGSTWAFALLHLLDGPLLILRTLAAGVCGVFLLRRAGVPLRLPRLDPVWFAALVPIAAWVAFILWRGAVIPVVTHDALAYHLPKAVLYERLGRYDRLSMLIENIRTLPANYEMLLADVIATTGSDRLTEWISTIIYLGMLSAAAALASRWWPNSIPARAAAVILTAGIPVALLHSGSHKNDLLTAFFMLSAVVWFARWLQTTELVSVAAFVIAIVAATGTKPQAASLGGICVIVGLPVLFRSRPSLRQLLLLVIVAVVAAAFLGGAVYATNYFSEGSSFSVGTRDKPAMMAYGDWGNLWRGPWVLLTAPFSSDPSSIFVPGEEGRWFWRRYEIFFSHLGIPFSIVALLSLPLLAMARRKGSLPAGLPGVLVATVASVASMLPVVFVPAGMYLISLPRYVLFFAPVVFCAAAGALLELTQPARRAVGYGLVAVGALFFAWYAIDNARKDTFAPFDFVRWAARHPGTRVIPFDQQRAASLIDRWAEPDDAVALDSAVATWIHPAFGADLTRRVDMIDTRRSFVIADDVMWVGIDRAYQVVWGHTEFRNLAQVRKYLMAGQLKPEDRRLFDAMRADGRFEMVFYNPKTMQAVFRRVRASAPQ